MLINLLLTSEPDEQKALARFQALVPLALVKIDKYLVPHPDVDLQLGEDAVDCQMQRTMNEG